MKYFFLLLLLKHSFSLISKSLYIERYPSRFLKKNGKVLSMNDNKYSKEYYQYLKEFKPDKLINIRKKGLGLGYQDNISETFQNDYEIFEKNLDFIKQFNQETDLSSNIELGINQFTDNILYNQTHTAPDINKFGNLVDIDLKYEYKDITKYDNNIPVSFSWLNKSILTDVYDQGYCGSCWAFSTCRAIEAFMRINNYTIERLSEQELLDCSKKNFGCNGGYMHLAFEYCIENDGLVSYNDYPYQIKSGNCSLSCSNCKKIKFSKVVGSNISSYVQVTPGSTEEMKRNLLINPIAIAVDASSPQFRFYKSGVISIPSKNSTELNHAVLLVGYQNDNNGEYWIIQNSWGEKWGEDGYANIRITEGLGTLLCQLYAFYPV